MQLGLAALELFGAFLAFPPPCPPPKRRPCRAFVLPTACRLTPELSDLQPAELCKSTFCIIGILHVDLLQIDILLIDFLQTNILQIGFLQATRA